MRTLNAFFTPLHAIPVWGHRSVELLIDKVHFKKNPAAVKDVSELVPVTKNNLEAFAKNWEKWLPK